MSRLEQGGLFIYGISAAGWYCYLMQYLSALSTFLEERSWTDRLLLSVSDEPNEANVTEYRAPWRLPTRRLPIPRAPRCSALFRMLSIMSLPS